MVKQRNNVPIGLATGASASAYPVRTVSKVQASGKALGVIGLLTATALALTGCFPYVSLEVVPPVSDGLLPSTSFLNSAEEILVLVLWRDGIYRWSRDSVRKPPFLAPPSLITVDDLPRLDVIAKKYRNYGVVAFDQHAGTAYQHKEPGAELVYRFLERIPTRDIVPEEVTGSWQMYEGGSSDSTNR